MNEEGRLDGVRRRTLCQRIDLRVRRGLSGLWIQEDQLSALGLVVNAIVLWNTLYLDAALNHLRHSGVEVRDEDIVRLWPLGWEHINFLGRYSFALSELVARGEMRPLMFSEDVELA